MKKIYLLIVIALLSVSVKAGRKPFVSKKDMLGTRVFIENKGQYDREVKTKDKIYYALDNNDEQIYFTDKGLVYKLINYLEPTERNKERLEHGEKLKADVYYINMNWQNANSIIQIEQSEKQSNYFTYGDASWNCSGFKKITYKNVYNNIDIEYTIPTDKEHGIKYNVILHPGANANDIKMAYSGDVNRVVQRGNDIIIKTPYTDITEYAPNSFYDSNESISSQFKLDNKIIGFDFPDSYQNNRTVIIDPYVTTLTTLSTTNGGYDVDYDYYGNLFVYGGYRPKVAKYDPSGLLLWTFMGQVVTPVWNSEGNYGPSLKIVGNFVVDKITSKSYMGEGYNSLGTQIIRIDAAGNYDSFISTKVSNWQEVWDMGFHCATGNVYGLGGGTNSNLSAGPVNPITGAVTPITFVPSGPSAGQDIACNTIDDAGTVWIYYAAGSGTAPLNNKIAMINSAFTATVYGVASTYNTLNEGANKNQYGLGVFSNGFNCLAVNSNYLYFYDGFNLAAYNKTTGTKVGFTTIAGNTPLKQGGIAVDDCDNVYVGGSTKMDMFKFNGTSFTATGNIPLAASTATQLVWDIKLDKNTNILYVTGSGFVGTYSAVNSLTCAMNQFSLSTVCVGNNNGTAVASVTTSISSPLFSYVWSNGTTTLSSVTNTTASSNTVTGLASGIYTVSINVNAPCGPVYVTTVNVNCTIPCAGTPGATVACSGPNTNVSLSLTGLTGFSTTPTFTWTGPGSYTSNAQNPTITNGASGIYTITASNTSCTYVGTVSVNSAIINPTIVTNGTVTCTSGATLSANSVPANYTYTWTGPGIVGSSNTQSITVNSGGVYAVTITNTVTSCAATATAFITQSLGVPSITVNPISGNLTCNGAPACFTAVCTPTLNTQGQWYAPGGVPIGSLSNSPILLCSNSPGIYTVVVNDITNGCTGTQTVSISAPSTIPTMTVNALNGFTFTCNQPCLVFNITASAGPGPISYSWTNMTTSVTTMPITGGYTVCNPGSPPGNYLAEYKDGNGCKVSQMISVSIDTLRPTPLSMTNLPSNSYTLSCYQPSLVATGYSSPLLPAINYSWTVPPNLTVSSNTIMVNTVSVTANPTTFTVLAKGTNGCVGKQKVLFYKDVTVPPYSAIFTPSAITCDNPQVAMSPLSTSSSTIPVTFTFTSPAPTTTANASGSLFGIPGTYTMTYQNTVNGCIGITTTVVPINVTPPSTVTIPPAVIPCGANTVNIIAGTNAQLPSYTYIWFSPAGAGLSCASCYSTSVNTTGNYFVVITNTINGCQAYNYVSVSSGSMSVSFTMSPESGFSPLPVTFTNTSQLGSLTSGSISTIWNYGNGITYSVTNASSGGSPNGSTIYQSAGSYTVLLIVQESVGTTTCVGTATAVVSVELPSELIIPNIFTPNGDGVNDFFTVQSTSLSDINIIIYDRWGVKMYEVFSEKAAISWDGKNLSGKEVPAGTYFYLLNANGKDGNTFEKHGAISLYK